MHSPASLRVLWYMFPSIPLYPSLPPEILLHRPGGDEGMFLDGLHHIIKLDLGGACPAVVDDGLPIRAIPAVHYGIEQRLKLGP